MLKIDSDEQGVYYWHKRTGTVTRERPALILDSPTSTLSSSSSNEICFETNALLYKSDSTNSIKVEHVRNRIGFERKEEIFFNRQTQTQTNGIVFMFVRWVGQ